MTENQAKIYLFLVQSGTATVKQISKVVTISKEDIYRTMPKMQKMGLIQKNINSPLTLTAIPMKEVCSPLVERKTIEIYNLRNAMDEMIENLENNKPRPHAQEEPAEFILIPGRKALISKALRELENAEKSVRLTISYKRYMLFLSDYSKIIEKVLKRNIQYRVLTDIPDETKLPEVMKALQENPSYEIRCANAVANFAVYDGKRILISTSTDSGLAKAPALWSNNASLVRLAENYFDNLWYNSRQVNTE